MSPSSPQILLLGDHDPGAWESACAHALADPTVSAPGRRAWVSMLTGGATGLGAFHHLPATLTERGASTRIVRRAVGGRVVALGAGLLAVALWFESRAALAVDGEQPPPLDRVLNRGVRPLLATLARMGFPVTYMGRDFLSFRGGQAVSVSFSVGPTGRVLVSCLLPSRAHWWMPDGLLRHPAVTGVRGSPAPVMVPGMEKLSAGTVAQTLAAQWGGGSVDTADVVPAHGPPVPTSPPVTGELWTETEIPSGRLETHVRLADGRLRDMRWTGDLLAAPHTLDALRSACLGASVSDAVDVQTAWSRILTSPDHVWMGAPPVGQLWMGLGLSQT